MTQLPAGSVLQAWAELYGRSAPRNNDLRAAFHVAATAVVATPAPAAAPALPERAFHALAVAYQANSLQWPRFDVVHRRETGGGRRTPPPPYILALLVDTDETARFAAYGCLQSLVQQPWGAGLLVRGALRAQSASGARALKTPVRPWNGRASRTGHDARRAGPPTGP